jgi:uncharacterized protein YgiM (DUF1202 family)
MSKGLRIGIWLIGCWLSAGLAHADLGGAITVEATALRASASNAAASLQELPAESRLRILKRQGGWYQVQTASGQQGWLALLMVRLDKSASAKGGNVSELLQGSTAVVPASGVATGVRGVSDEQLEAGAAASASPLPALQRYAVSPSRARAFAQSAGLRSQPIAYPADAK